MYLFKSNLLTLTCFFFSITMPIFSLGQGFSDQTAAAMIILDHDGDNLVDHRMGTGAAWLDYDKDGNLDLYVTMRTTHNKLYKNNGNGTFTDVAVGLGISDPTGDGGGVSIVDFNNDGWDDIFLANCQGNILYKNNNGMSFSNITPLAFADGTAGGDSRSPSASWGDYDNDGFLDLYIANHYQTIYNPTGGTIQDFLFHNNGDETFTDVSNLLTVSNLMGVGFIGGWSDYDKDGDMDIFLINDCPVAIGLPTKVFRNDGGTNPTTWNFTEVSVSIGIDDCRNGMGFGLGDFNRDGWQDLFYTNIGDCVLFQNNGGTFTDISASAGIDGQPATHYSWGCSFMDYDMDGWQDIIVAIGTLSINPATDPQPNNFFRNNGDGTFTEMASTLGLADNRPSRNAIYGDYDNDGDLDIYVVNYGDNCILNRNDNNNGNHWFKLHLEGTQSNQDGLGSKIELSTPDGVTQHFETRSGSNLGAGDSPYAHFGLGSNTTVSELKITWLSGEVQTFSNLSADMLFTATEPLSALPVELVDFTAEVFEDVVKLNWSTASERDNDYFEVERSIDGINFLTLGKIQGRGTTGQLSNYQLQDNHPQQGINYYRLKQVDLDGKFSFSDIEQIEFTDNETSIHIFPNPSKIGFLNMNFVSKTKNTTIEIYDMLGRLVYQNKIENIGSQSLTIPTKDWSNGIFIVSISNVRMEKKLKVVIDN